MPSHYVHQAGGETVHNERLGRGNAVQGMIPSDRDKATLAAPPV